jgi:hypothetical protein
VEISGYNRLQVTLFLPRPIGPRIDEIRSTWDPTMATRITSHVTVLRRVPDPEAVVDALERASMPGACRLRLAGVDRAPTSEGGGIYLRVDDPFSDLMELRNILRPACDGGVDAIQEFAHVTLLHPRTRTPEQRDRAWVILCDSTLVEDVMIQAVSLIGETDRGWAQIASFDLARS